MESKSTQGTGMPFVTKRAEMKPEKFSHSIIPPKLLQISARHEAKIDACNTNHF